MSRIEDIESAIRGLSPDELDDLRKWFMEFDAESWDRQIESDARSGKLDDMAKTALSDHETGKTSEI